MFEKSFLITYSSPQYIEESIIFSIIRAFPHWGKLTDTSWLIKTNLQPLQIHDLIRPHLPSDARLFVTKVQKNAAWSNLICSNEWLLNNLSLL